MDMNISGSGRIASGEYDAIRVSGSCASVGLIRCKSFHCSGCFSGESDIECENDIHISGSFSNGGGIKANGLSVSGSAKNGGSVLADIINVSGSFKTKGDVKASELKISGAIETKGDIEAENARITGGVRCCGLINAEKLHIEMSNSRDSRAASIGGGSIVIERKRKPGIITRLFGGWENCFTVEESIEGDEITIDHTRAKTVSGRYLKIGEGCEIDLVQYTEDAEISPEAKVGKVEKV